MAQKGERDFMKKAIRNGLAVVFCLALLAGDSLTANREADQQKKKLESTKTTVQPSPSSTAAVHERGVKQNNTLQLSPQVGSLINEPTAPPASPAAGALMTGEQINWFVISSGATNASSTNYQLHGTVGQLAVGQSNSTNYKINSGYWQDFGAGGCCQLRGNINAIGTIDISDLTYLVAYMFKGGPIPPPC